MPIILTIKEKQDFLDMFYYVYAKHGMNTSGFPHDLLYMRNCLWIKKEMY